MTAEMTGGLAGPATTVEEREAAQRQGRLAGREGRTLSTCPYDANGDARNRSLALSWVRGFVSAIPTDE